MPNRIRAALIASLTLIGSQFAVAPVGAVVAPQKVVIIVGPTGALTDNYRLKGDAIATTATAAGATVIKVYSPAATWANVKAAVNGANIVVYLGHGNGFPDPYGATKLGDRVDGWGLNRTTTGGDSDDWSAKMVYCGEKALLGTLTSSDGAAQRTYCAGGPITPAPNWAMIYSNACYTPGASEGWDVPATEAVALQRVRNYSYPGLKLAGGAYFATDMYQGSLQLVDSILRNPDMPFGAIAEKANGYDLTRQRHYDHQDLAGSRIWLQNSGDPLSGDYFLAYAGKPTLTPAGAIAVYSEPVPPPIVTNGATTTYNPPAPLTFRIGTHTGYIFTSTGVLTAQKTYTLGHDSGASTSTRTTITNQSGTWFYITNGVWAGYWMRESAVMSLASSPITASPAPNATFSPAATLNFKMGTHTGYQFSSTGALTAFKTYTLGHGSGANTSTRSAITNQSGTWFYVTNGVWAGYWMRASDVLSLAPG